MGSSSADRGARAIAKYLKVLVPASCSHNLRISNELARHLDGGTGASGTALVVSPFGKIWRIEVARGAEDRAFLGRGWPEFVPRTGSPRGGMVSVKAFDTTCCLREFSRPISGLTKQGLNSPCSVAKNRSEGGGAARRPHFIKLLLGAFMEKMLIPPEFVRKYIAEPEMKSSATILLSPLCKFCQVPIEKDKSGNQFFSGGWSQFLASHGVTEHDVLLLRHEGRMVFTVKVFGPDGCQKGCKDKDTSSKELHQSDKTTFVGIETDHEDPPSTSRKRKSMLNEKPGGEEKKKKKPGRYTAASNKASSSTRISVYEIGPPSWMKKEISAYTLSNHLCQPISSIAIADGRRFFCKAIGLRRISEITLRMTADEGHGIRSWKVGVLVYRNRSRGQITQGWRRFCLDNGIKEGDICTFNIVKTTLWHFDITRRG